VLQQEPDRGPCRELRPIPGMVSVVELAALAVGDVAILDELAGVVAEDQVRHVAGLADDPLCSEVPGGGEVAGGVDAVAAGMDFGRHLPWLPGNQGGAVVGVGVGHAVERAALVLAANVVDLGAGRAVLVVDVDPRGRCAGGAAHREADTGERGSQFLAEQGGDVLGRDDDAGHGVPFGGCDR